VYTDKQAGGNLQRPDGCHTDGVLRGKGGYVQHIGCMPLRAALHREIELLPASQQQLFALYLRVPLCGVEGKESRRGRHGEWGMRAETALGAHGWACVHT
jgi:hypothetical protein